MCSLRLPKIKPVDNNGGIRFDFVINGVRYTASPIYGAKYNNLVDLAKAEVIASQIVSDIASGKFDYSDTKLSKYRVRDDEGNPCAIVSANKNVSLNLLDLWEKFEERQKGRVQETTFKNAYKRVRNALKKLTAEQLKLDNTHILVDTLLKYYSVRTLEQVFTHLKACGSWAVLIKLLPENPFSALNRQLPKRKKKSDKPECFTTEEVRLIIDTFKKERHFYADFVEFLLLTGCRPEDAIALTWDDVKPDEIIFNKAYSCGVLKNTKTNTSRKFPVNGQLHELLCRRRAITYSSEGKCQLVFPSATGGYIHLKNFSFRQWKKTVQRLFQDGKISKYLPVYNVRHTFISLMLRKGVDMQTVAQWCGTSVQMLQRHYWSPDREVQIPEI